MGTKRGQALIELAMGMFALALVVSALVGFAVYIAKDLAMQNSLRVGDSAPSETMEVSGLTAKYIFGTDKVRIREAVKMPERGIR